MVLSALHTLQNKREKCWPCLGEIYTQNRFPIIDRDDADKANGVNFPWQRTENSISYRIEPARHLIFFCSFLNTYSTGQ
jgi:hypothetical protein